jgi:hypothetical protein
MVSWPTGALLTYGHYVAMVRCQNGEDFAYCNDNRIGDNPARKQEFLERAESEDFQSILLVYQKIGGKMAKNLDPKEEEEEEE